MKKEPTIVMLLADDEQTLRNGIASMPWTDLGITLLPPAKNGIEALDLFYQHKVDILLTDIRMPGMSGIELSEAVRRKDPDVEIIFLSGYSDFSYAQKAITLGAANYILKPSTPQEIWNIVSKARESLLAKAEKRMRMESLQRELKNLTRVVEVSSGEEDLSEKEEANIQSILNYIGENYAKQLNLPMLADHFHFNAGYLSRFIKKKTGHTFTALLTSTRMYHAARLLRETSWKNRKISEQIGMNDERYFGQVFQNTFGMSPIEYRKRSQKDLPDIQKMLLGDFIEDHES